MSKKPTDVGMNRTGIATSPIDAKRTIEGAMEGSPVAIYETPESVALRRSYSEEAPPTGTMPPPATIKGMAKAVIQALKAEKTTVLLDKLAERLAFERGGVRLYELLLIKFDAAAPNPDGPTREDLEEIHADELRHFAMLASVIREMGADPTAMTPGANAVAVKTMGVVQLLSDPRTTFTQALEAMQMIELADNDCWDNLAALTEALGKDDLAVAMRAAVADEREHLASIRQWVSATVLGQAGVGEGAGDEAGASAPPG